MSREIMKTTTREQITILVFKHKLSVLSSSWGITYLKGEHSIRLSHKDTEEDLDKLKAWLAEIEVEK